jgi:hypothetical protein
VLERFPRIDDKFYLHFLLTKKYFELQLQIWIASLLFTSVVFSNAESSGKNEKVQREFSERDKNLFEAFDCARNEEHGKMKQVRKHGLSVECELGHPVNSLASNEWTISKSVKTLKSRQTHGQSPNKFINWKAEWAETISTGFPFQLLTKKYFPNPFYWKSCTTSQNNLYSPKTSFFAKKCKKEFPDKKKM